MSYESWRRSTEKLRGKKEKTGNAGGATLSLPGFDDLPLPGSGKVTDIPLLPEYAMPEAASPPPVVFKEEGQPLRDYQSSLTNSREERENTSNLLSFWEKIPRYRCGELRGVVSSEDSQEVGIVEYQFEDAGEPYRMVMTPARILATVGGVEKELFCYPDTTEELVEMALIHITMENGDLLDIPLPEGSGKGPGRPSYGVHFSINQIERVLKQWGRGRPYPAIVRALEVLHKCTLEIKSLRKGALSASAPILSELTTFSENGFDRRDRNAYWTARFHPIISLGIHRGIYFQYNIYRTLSLRSGVAQVLARRVILEGRNISTEHPYRITLSEFRETTGMLNNYSRNSDAVRKFRNSVGEMERCGFLSRYEIKELRRGNRIEDVEVTLYASAELTKEMRAGHKREKLLQMRRLARQKLSAASS